MLRAALISLAVLAAPVAQACALELVSCEIETGRATLYDMSGDTVLFRDGRGLNAEGGGIVLVEYTSRAVLRATEFPGNADEASSSTLRIWGDSLHSDAVEAFPALARQVRRLGVTVQRTELAAGHCGCDLPQIPVYGCPALILA